jgi:glycosyltransferase involved in cell wall biosynthesis
MLLHSNMRNTLLKDVTLTAIVGDECHNPRGGVVDYIEHLIPFVENAVVVDTGSVDGTRKTLNILAERHENLHIFDRKFDGFSGSRNFAFKKARKLFGNSHVLVLDADELITQKDLYTLSVELDKNPKTAQFNLTFRTVSLSVKDYGSGNNPRVFGNIGFKYKDTYYERFCGNSRYRRMKYPLLNFTPKKPDVKVYHFFPPQKLEHTKPTEQQFFEGEPEDIKQFNWYGSINQHIENGVTPAQTEHYRSWKLFNRNRFMFGPVYMMPDLDSGEIIKVRNTEELRKLWKTHYTIQSSELA